METDELLRGLGVTARGERDVAREVIEDAAARAAEAEATARAKKRCNERDDDLPAASANATTTDDGGEGEGQRGGDGPALREVSRLRTEADGVARELLAVRDALDEIRASERDGTAPSDAALVVAVGNRRVTSLEEKRAELAVAVAAAEASAAEEASAAAAAAAAAERRGRGTDATAASGSGSKTKKK
jgi:DNA excision repair protein ERCC-6